MKGRGGISKTFTRACLQCLSFYRCFLRFKDNNIIDKSIHGYDKNLELSNVTGLVGKYQCRVVNDYGSEFSDIADLRVFSKSGVYLSRRTCALVFLFSL